MEACLWQLVIFKSIMGMCVDWVGSLCEQRSFFIESEVEWYKEKRKDLWFSGSVTSRDCDAVISFLEYLVDRSEKKPRIKTSATVTHLRIKTQEDIDRHNKIMASIQKNVDEYTSKPDHSIEVFKKKMDHIWQWGW